MNILIRKKNYIKNDETSFDKLNCCSDMWKMKYMVIKNESYMKISQNNFHERQNKGDK